MCAAVESHYERYGQAGAPTALAHVVTALLRSGAAPSAAPSSAPSSTPAETLLLLGLQRDMVAGYNPAMGAVPGGAALRLAPARVLSLRLLPPRDHSGDRSRDRTSSG